MSAPIPTQDLRGFTLVHVDVNIPTGTARVERSTDLDPTITGKLPPKALLKDGRKAVLDPAVLQPLYNGRKQVQRLLAEAGTSFFGGTLVPNDAVPLLAARITEIESAFFATRDTVAPELESHYTEWEAKHPAWAALFRANRMKEPEFVTACRFKVAMLTVAEPLTQEASTLFSKATAAIIPGFLEEIAKGAAKAYETHAKGRGKITQHGLAATKSLIGRLAAFALLDARIAPSCSGYTAVLQAMPKVGPLNPRETATLQGLLQQLMDPTRILEHGAATFAAAAEGAAAPEPDVDTAQAEPAEVPTQEATPIEPPPPVATQPETPVEESNEDAPIATHMIPTPRPASAANLWSASF